MYIIFFLCKNKLVLNFIWTFKNTRVNKTCLKGINLNELTLRLSLKLL